MSTNTSVEDISKFPAGWPDFGCRNLQFHTSSKEIGSERLGEWPHVEHHTAARDEGQLPLTLDEGVDEKVFALFLEAYIDHEEYFPCLGEDNICKRESALAAKEYVNEEGMRSVVPEIADEKDLALNEKERINEKDFASISAEYLHEGDLNCLGAEGHIDENVDFAFGVEEYLDETEVQLRFVPQDTMGEEVLPLWAEGRIDVRDKEEIDKKDLALAVRNNIDDLRGLRSGLEDNLHGKDDLDLILEKNFDEKGWASLLDHIAEMDVDNSLDPMNQNIMKEEDCRASLPLEKILRHEGAGRHSSEPFTQKCEAVDGSNPDLVSTFSYDVKTLDTYKSQVKDFELRNLLPECDQLNCVASQTEVLDMRRFSVGLLNPSIQLGYSIMTDTALPAVEHIFPPQMHVCAPQLRVEVEGSGVRIEDQGYCNEQPSRLEFLETPRRVEIDDGGEHEGRIGMYFDSTVPACQCVLKVDWTSEKDSIVSRMLGKKSPRKTDLEQELSTVINRYETMRTSQRLENGIKTIPHSFQKEITLITNKYCEREHRKVRYLPDFCKSFLRKWAEQDCHAENPYPTKNEILSFADDLGLTKTQVEHWFENYRIRNWKPKKEGTRKGKFFRYPIEDRFILRKWILDHKQNPNPRGKDLTYLTEATRMSTVQVKQWCYNFRRRNKHELI